MRAAILDVDWLGWVTFGDHVPLMASNLAAVWANFAAAGAEYAVMARMMLSRSELDALRAAVPDLDITVVRVESSPELVRSRLERRDTGEVLQHHLVQTAEYSVVVGNLGLEDLVVRNDDRPIRVLAGEVLDRLGWG